MSVEVIDVPELMAGVERLARRDLDRTKLELKVDCLAGIEPIVSQRRELEHVLVELLINATKFASPGKATFAARPAMSSSVRGPCIAFTIADNGPGIPLELLPKLMKEYPIPEVRALNKNGVGLLLVSSVARLLRGEVLLVTAPGKGLAVTLTLPVTAVDSPQQPPEPGTPRNAAERE